MSILMRLLLIASVVGNVMNFLLIVVVWLVRNGDCQQMYNIQGDLRRVKESLDTE